MVIDKLENAALYERLHQNLPGAFAFIRKSLADMPPAGRYEIDGTDVYALVQEYTPAPAEQKKWESHRNYLDVQFIASGREAMLYAPACALSPKGDYVSEKDFQGYDDGPSTALRCEEGTFALFWPGDAHKPGCALGEPGPVRKIVVKIRL